MRLMMVWMAAAMAGAALTPAPVQALTSGQSVAAPPSPRQMELTRRYLVLSMSDQFETAIRQMVVDQMEMDQTARDLPTEDRRFMIDLTAELTTDMIPQMIKAMIPVYARTFTEAELEAMLAFYDTEFGRLVLEKTMLAMPEANRAAMTVVPRMLDKMAARICQHYGCEPGELEEMQREMRGEATAAPRSK